MSAALQPRSPRRIGRFQVERELGRGAQGAVYLATDTRLGRQVALKTLHVGTEGAEEMVRTLLDEARIVSTLQHPNIVTLFDAGEEQGVPYLVFEYVEGKTLAALIREKGRLAPARAVDVALALARGIGYAHARNVVHRDLKPANVILTRDGVPRLMDFGIAQHGALSADPDAPLWGTPSYMAPEYISERSYAPVSDLFSLGVVLYEMLTGDPPVRGATLLETFHGILNGRFEPPSQRNPDVDERLDAIVFKALAKAPAERYASATELVDALARWLDPETPERPERTASTQATLEFLLRRIRHKSDFPALSATIGAINRAADSDREPVSVLCNSILKDFGLTNRLLKMVNAACYRQYGGTISTVSRAVAILGFNGVRSVAMTLLLFDHLQNKANAASLRDEIVATYFSGTLTQDLAQKVGVRDSEEAFICAMFHRLGKLLVTFYLHDEAQAIAGMMQARSWDEDRAARHVLGITYDELGAGVGRAWNLPEAIVASMRPVTDPVRQRPAQDAEKLRVVASLANSLADVVRNAAEDERTEQLAVIVEKFGRATGVTAPLLAAAVQASTERMAKEGDSLSMSVISKSDFMARAREWSDPVDPEPVAETDTATLMQSTALRAQAPDGGAAEKVTRRAGDQRQAVLAAGVQDITNTLAGDFRLNDVLRIILETMYRGMAFQRVLLFVLEPAKQALTCRFGFGADADSLAARGVSVPLAGARDVFFAAVGPGSDICIEDTDAEQIRQYVPQWYRSAIGARGFVLLPIVSAKRTVGLIYADAQTSNLLCFRPEELALLKTLRNQAVLAMRTQR